MNLPILYSSNPSIVPSRTYNKLWIEHIEISAPSPDQDIIARVRLRKFCQDENGDIHTYPESEKLEIDSLLSQSNNDPDLTNLIQALIGYIAKVGVESGSILPTS